MCSAHFGIFCYLFILVGALLPMLESLKRPNARLQHGRLVIVEIQLLMQGTVPMQRFGTKWLTMTSHSMKTLLLPVAVGSR